MLIVTTDELPCHRIRRVFGEVLGVALSPAQPGGPGYPFQQGGAGHGAGGTGGSGGAGYRGTGERPLGLMGTRREAMDRLAEDARRLGANAVVGMRFDTAFLAGAHEVCAYGTAVWAEPATDRPAQRYDAGVQQMPQTPPGAPPMMARNLTVGLQSERPR